MLYIASFLAQLTELSPPEAELSTEFYLLLLLFFFFFFTIIYPPESHLK